MGYKQGFLILGGFYINAATVLVLCEWFLLRPGDFRQTEAARGAHEYVTAFFFPFHSAFCCNRAEIHCIPGLS